ncbi:hypothetical protein [Erythrobacter mangrovi]|uniref:Uncharacterized protein n=1 Tax=Erythrobacter mangrovi TaxID=2739433 RepID=A0A7D4CDA2_9SPHN|nr:hypothetical protein [Erythrobacter mangrovi]QKG71469.1 hypothetical protein HQR01_08895 [Erythrobacter mangrovi]
MGMHARIPEQFAARAERRHWFNRTDAAELLDWLEDSGCRFIGMEVAEKRADGTWTLLDETLDLGRQTDNFEAVRLGRVFLSEYDGEGRMFEPVWQDMRA